MVDPADDAYAQHDVLLLEKPHMHESNNDFSNNLLATKR
jgi:hypothetical protein